MGSITYGYSCGREGETLKQCVQPLIFFLAFSAFINIPIVYTSPTFFEEELPAPSVQSFYLPQAKAEGYDYLNTTNPMGTPDPLAEVATPEGDRPLYALVFVDEEARSKLYATPNGNLEWKDYTIFQIERGDESLVGYFGIDIRIIDILPWDSPDHLTVLCDLLSWLRIEKRYFLGTWYGSQWWANFVDVIVGVTAQTTDNYAGWASSGLSLDKWETCVILVWQGYWMDDNLVQHEFSHLFHAPDHGDSSVWCAMSNEKQFVTYIWEDGLFLVFGRVSYVYLAYEWCTAYNCKNLISTYKMMYADEEYPYILVVRHQNPSTPQGVLNVYPGVIVSTQPFETTIEVVGTYDPFEFHFWLVDGRNLIFTKTLVVHVDGKRAVAAYYKQKYTPSPPNPLYKIGGNGLKMRLR